MIRRKRGMARDDRERLVVERPGRLDWLGGLSPQSRDSDMRAGHRSRGFLVRVWPDAPASRQPPDRSQAHSHRLRPIVRRMVQSRSQRQSRAPGSKCLRLAQRGPPGLKRDPIARWETHRPTRLLEVIVKRILATGLALVAFACGGTNIEPVAPSSTVTDDSPAGQARSVEWIYATDDLEGDQPRACGYVASVLEGESACKGVACRHAALLAADWLDICPPHASPQQQARIEGLQGDFAARAQKDKNECAEQVEVWLREGCGENAACEPAARNWATRCGSEVGSALVLTMLELTIAQSFPEYQRVGLDARNCVQLATELRLAAVCDSPPDCKLEIPKIDAYRQHCRANNVPFPTREGLAAAYILGVANQPTDKIPVAAEPRKLTSNETPLPLADGSGAVFRVCDRGPGHDLVTYLEKRLDCPGGTVMVGRFVTVKGSRRFQVGRYFHEDDGEFALLYPALFVQGEREVRHERALKKFSERVRVAAGNAAVHELVRALSLLPDEVREGEALRKILAENDEQLTPLFRELGKAKNLAVGYQTSRRDRVVFLRRAEKLPLADVNGAGSVELGAWTLASGLGSLREAMPKAFEAYSLQLGPLRAKAKEGLRDADVKVLEDAVVAQAVACGEANRELHASRQALLACGEKVLCPDEQAEPLQAKVLAALQRAREGRVLTQLAVHSLPPARLKAASEAAFGAGTCPQHP